MGLLRSISLVDFRNYDKLDATFEDGVNLFIGQNGQGKTNLLEAIQYLSILRSFRTNKTRPLLRHGCKNFWIRGQLSEDDGHTTKLGLQVGEQRRFMVDGEIVNRATDFIGRFFCVTFVPEDIELIKGSGSDRRRFLDMVVSQLYPGYMSALQDYAKALKARNTLLREERVNERSVRAYDHVLADRGALILQSRLQFIHDFTERVHTIAGELYPADRQLRLRYRSSIDLPDIPEDELPSLDAITDAVRATLADYLQRDIARQHTQRGPHRDDILLYLDDHQLTNYGSEGQCRLAVLALKIAAGDLVLQRKDDDIVVWLIDDVVGELDDRARAAFFAAITRADQAFIVATNDTLIDILNPTAIYDIQSATLTRREKPKETE